MVKGDTLIMTKKVTTLHDVDRIFKGDAQKHFYG